MYDLGHEVFLYAGDENDAHVTELVPVVTKAQQKKWFGHYDWERDVFDGWNSEDEWWRHMNIAATAGILQRARPGDFVCIISGWCQQVLSDLGLTTVEWGVGYKGVLPNSYRCFESYAWMHHIAAKQESDDIRYFDTVIPNSFDVDEFPAGTGDGDFAFLGRLIRRKGPHIAAEVCKILGERLILAGQGLAENSPHTSAIMGKDGVVVDGNVTHIGRVNIEQRARLLGQAKALFVPTIYLEPFGGVAVEAMLCGTPVITSDWGAFTEYVIDGFNGFRCRTLADFVRAARTAPHLPRADIRKWAQNRFSTDVVAPRYEAWFRKLETLHRGGWYELA
jgi:glycosyltransferase involved in cell wall biosynthesis